MAKNPEDAGAVGRIHLGLGFHDGDRGFVASALTALNRHLDHWRAESVDIDLAVKDRDHPEQRITLEIRLPRQPSLVVHVSDPDIGRALIEARRLMIRELEEVRSGIASPTKNAQRNASKGK